MKGYYSKSVGRLQIRELGAVKFIGWKSKLRTSNRTFLISVNKAVVLGTGLKKGNNIFCYLLEDQSGRPIMVTYLDGRPRFGGLNEKI